MAEEDKFKALINLLSKYISDNEIDINENLDSLKEALQKYMKTNSAKQLSNLKSLLHTASGHGLQLIRLECGKLHCHDCYLSYIQENSWNPELTCECGKLITPLYKNRINQNEARLVSLKRICAVCNHSQDKMNFPLLANHGCLLCIDCIADNFDMRAQENRCRVCHSVYTQEPDSIVRSIIESGMEIDEIKEIYFKECMICNVKKDSRMFEMYCASQCKACAECVKKIVREQKVCNVCKKEISVNMN